MIRRVSVFCVVLLLTANIVVLSGCALLLVGAAAGAGGFVWANGALETNLDYPVERVYKASLGALKKLDLKTKKDVHDKLSARLESDFSDGTNIWIDVDAVTEKKSKLRVRVGVLGDKAKSEMILNTIKRYL